MTRLNCKRTVTVPSGQRDALPGRRGVHRERPRKPFPRGSSTAEGGTLHALLPESSPRTARLPHVPPGGTAPQSQVEPPPVGPNHPGPCRGLGLPMHVPGGRHHGGHRGSPQSPRLLISWPPPGAFLRSHRASPITRQQTRGSAPCSSLAPCCWLRAADRPPFTPPLPDTTGLAGLVGLSCQTSG